MAESGLETPRQVNHAAKIILEVISIISLEYKMCGKGHNTEMPPAIGHSKQNSIRCRDIG